MCVVVRVADSARAARNADATMLWKSSANGSDGGRDGDGRLRRLAVVATDIRSAKKTYVGIKYLRYLIKLCPGKYSPVTH